MKKIILFSIVFLLFGGAAVAQDAISYQAIARDNAGAILSNQNISVKFEIRQGSMTGTSVFTETHTATTNQFGLFTLAIGSVSATQFQTINWGNMPYFMEVSIDPAGGTSYTSVGNQQLMSVPYALYAKTAGNAGITPTISINSPNTVTSAAGSYTINVPAATTYSAGTGIAISGGVISNTAVATTPTITGTGGTTVNSSGNTFTVSSQAYTAGSGISISSGVISSTVSGSTPTISGTGVSSVSSAGSTFTVNTPAPALSYTALGNQLSVSQGTAVSTVTLVAGNVYGLGTVGQVPMWGTITSLTTSPITTFTTTGGVVINPTLVGNGSPAQSLQVHGPSSSSTFVAHFLHASNANTGIGISTQPIGGHAIGSLNNQDLGFFTSSANATGGFPLLLKSVTGRVGIATTSPNYQLDVNGGINTSQFYNLNGLAAAPPTSSSGDGKIYFNSSTGKFMKSENGGPWLALSDNFWTQGSGILYNTTLADNVGIGTNTPSNKLSVLANSTVATLKAVNQGGGNGIDATTNSGGAAILGYNEGTGVSISGSKSLTTASGNAGSFDIYNPGNASNALVASTVGNGVAVHAISASTGTTATNLSVLLEDGHLKARFNTPLNNSDVNINSNSLGTISLSAIGGADQSNDVRGVIIFNGSYTITAGSSASTYVTVSFKKKYKNAPIITLTPSFPSGFTDNVIVTAQLVNVGLTDFTFKLSVNYPGSGGSVSTSQFNVCYMIME